MPEAQCIKYRIKPGHREALVNWITGLENRSKEMLMAMAEGRLLTEAVFIERTDSGDHILIYTSAKDLRAGMEALSKSNLPIVQEFNQLMIECVDIENAASMEFIYHTP